MKFKMSKWYYENTWALVVFILVFLLYHVYVTKEHQRLVNATVAERYYVMELFCGGKTSSIGIRLRGKLYTAQVGITKCRSLNIGDLIPLHYNVEKDYYFYAGEDGPDSGLRGFLIIAVGLVATLIPWKFKRKKTIEYF